MRIPHYFSLFLLLLTLSMPVYGFAEDTTSSSGGSSASSSASTTSSTTSGANASTDAATTSTDGAVNLENVDGDLANAPTKSDSIYEFKASLGFGFEYDDNIEGDNDNRVSAFMTHIKPMLSFKRQGGRIEADITYSGDYVFYLHEKSEPEYQHTIDATITAEVIKNLFFINISENMQQVYDDVTKGEFQDGDDDVDARNRNIITIGPYITLKPSDRTDLTIGYTFTDTRYSANQNSDMPYFLSINGEQYDFSHNVNQSHAGYFKLTHELSDRASIYTGGGATRIVYDSKDSTDTTRYNLYVGGTYAFSDSLSASLEVGPNYSVPDAGDATLSPYVQASLKYAVGRSVFSLAYNTSFEDDPESDTAVYKSSYSLSWNKKFDRSNISLGISYNTYESEFSGDATQSGNEEQGNTFSPTASFSYELTDRLTALMRYNGNIYQDHTLGDHRHTGSYGLSYELSESTKVSLTHSLEYNIPYEEAAYLDNRVSVDIAYTF